MSHMLDLALGKLWTRIDDLENKVAGIEEKPAEYENEETARRLKLLLRRAKDALIDVEDAGPAGRGWKSNRLVILLDDIDDVL